MTTAEQRVVECAVRAIHTGRMFEASLTLAARARAGVERGRAMDALIDAVDALGGASPGSDGDVVRDGGGAMTAAERLAVVTAERDDARLMSQCNRDNWRLAGEQRDALARAVREVEESEGALETMIDDSGWTLDDERIAEERVAAAHAALDAALAAAEGR